MLTTPSVQFARAESLVTKLPEGRRDTHAIGYDELLNLVKEGFLKKNDFIGPDDCSDVESILDYLKDSPYLKLHGELIEREDEIDFCCDNINGWKPISKKFTLKQQLDFALRFRHADELEVSDQTLYAWFD
jgi:hypothetical protein